MYSKFIIRKKTILAAVFMLLGMLSLQSCMKDNFSDIKSVVYKPGFAMPLFNSELKLSDIIQNFDSGGLMQEDPNSHLLSLVYTNSIKSPYASKLFSIPSQTWSKQIGMTASDTVQFLANTTITLPYLDTVKFNFPDATAKVMNILLKSGNLKFDINSTFKHSGVLTFSFPTVTKNGLAFSQVIPITYTSGPVVVSTAYDLTGYNFDLSAGGKVNNSLPVDISLTMTYNSGNPVYPADNIKLQASLSNFNFSFMDGYLGVLPFPSTNDTLDISFFNNNIPGGVGSISFFDPKLTIDIDNSFGLPVEIHFSKLKAFNKNTSVLLSGTAPIAAGPVLVNYPTASQVGQTASTSFSLDKNNSNIDNVFNVGPTGMEYAMSIKSNPTGTPPYNFITDTSRFKLNLKAELPMWGRVKNMVFVDTLDLAFNVAEQVQSVIFKINTDNGFPLDADLQIYFTDSNMHRLDSLTVPGQNIIASGIVNGAGDVIAPTHKTTSILVDEKRFTYIKKRTTKALVLAKLITTGLGSKDVKILSTYKVDVKLGLLLNLKIE